jgi:hypothetical protein
MQRSIEPLETLLIVFFDREKFLPVRNISAFYDLEHLCMGSHFGTTLSFSRLDGVCFTSYRSNTSATIKNTIYFSENNRYSKSKNRDSMALIQCMDAKKHRIFGDLATDYCRQLTSCFAKAHTVADVFDR